MASIVVASSSGLDYALYGDKTHLIAGYVRHQLEQMPQGSDPYQSRIYDTLQASYNYLTDTSIQYGIQRQLVRHGVDMGESYVSELRTFEELQNANLVMQRFIMAEPTLRGYYLAQNVDGYSDTYVNTSGKYVGERDYNYQLIMSGVPVDYPDGSSITSFYPAEDNLLPGDRVRTHHEKVAMKHTWENMRAVISELGFDFTCKSEVPVKINFE